jgi:subtilisin family serine protease
LVADHDVDGPEAWDIAVGDGVIIAMVDTGVDSDHEDLAGKLVPGETFVLGTTTPEDDSGHGSATASVAAAQTNNAVGVAGACWNCRIMPLKVWDLNGQGPHSQTADGIVWATDHGARVINVSGGYSSSALTLQSAVQYAYDAGTIQISITHNGASLGLTFPGRYPETLAIGATDRIDDRAEPFSCDNSGGSNYGPRIDVVAPGDDIEAATIGGYGPWCGTSFSAPLVSGLVGLMQTVYPSVGREEVRHLIRSGADDQVGSRLRAGTTEPEDTPGFDDFHGWGRVNMDLTLQGTQASITLRVDGTTSTRVFYDTANPLADSYDFVRGDLDALNESVAGVDVGTVVCLEDDSIDPDTAGDEDLATPDPGSGFFYLGRFNAAPGHGWYGGSSVNRDRLPASGNCPGCGNDIIEGSEMCDGPDLAGETCASQGFGTGTLACNQSCDGFDTSACATCGNDVCEILGGEDCLSCPADCNGVQSGNPNNQFCCGDGAGSNPVACDDARCTGDGNTCAN